MTGTDAIKVALLSTKNMLGMYLGDLSDADLLVRPQPNANHIAWQLGHTIAAEIHLIKQQIPDAAYVDLPPGFVEAHGKETAAKDSGFLTKGQYLNLYNAVREGTLTALSKLTDADLDKPTQGPMAPFAPNLGAFFILVSNHVLMHAGQFTVVRRKLGKPIVF